MIMWPVVGVLARRGRRLASGWDGSPEVARVGAGSTGRPVPGSSGRDKLGSAAGSQRWRGQLCKCVEGGEGEGGDRCAGAQVQQPPTAGTRVAGRNREQP